MQVSADSYSIAGVVVRTTPENMDRVVSQLSGVSGVDVHHREASTGRIIITLETEGADERDRLEDLRALTGVVSVELVYHYADQDGETGRVN